MHALKGQKNRAFALSGRWTIYHIHKALPWATEILAFQAVLTSNLLYPNLLVKL